MKLKRTFLTLIAASLLLGVPAHAGLFGSKETEAEKQEKLEKKKAEALQERDAMMKDLYAADPKLKEVVAKSAGYATFKQLNVNLLLLATARGGGVLTETKTGKITYMRMASVGGGLGAGLKDLRVIFVFTDPKVMKQFMEEGWQFGGQADAAAKAGETGASAEGTVKGNVSFEEGTVTAGGSTDTRSGSESKGTAAMPGGMQVYQFTESGLALQATVSGTKYWKDSDLNK
jgi:hypothetical protein